VRKSTFNVGQISNQTIVAPFNFYIYEDPEVLKNKQVKAEERVLSKYQLSDDVTFDVQSHINEFYSLLDKAFVRDSLNSDLILNFDQDGYGFSEQELKFLENKDAREQLFEFLLVKVKSVLGVGILKSEPNNEKITLVEGNTEKVVSIKELFTKKTALNYILNQRTPRFRSDEWKSIIEKVLNNILQPNIIYDKDATGIAKKRASESVPPVLGEVLKNELIVQEHQKITGDMLRKLDALEQAEQQRTLTEQAGKLGPFSRCRIYLYFSCAFSLYYIIIFHVSRTPNDIFFIQNLSVFHSMYCTSSHSDNKSHYLVCLYSSFWLAHYSSRISDQCSSCNYLWFCKLFSGSRFVGLEDHPRNDHLSVRHERRTSS